MAREPDSLGSEGRGRAGSAGQSWTQVSDRQEDDGSYGWESPSRGGNGSRVRRPSSYGGNGSHGRTPSSLSEDKESREHARKRRRSASPTHAVAITSAYTSGFGGSLDDDEQPVRRGKYRRGSWGRGKSRKRYRTGAPVRRVPDDPADVEACREAALTLLDAAARSSGALVKRLVTKGYDPVVSQQVVDRLVEIHLIDDEDYARSVIRACSSRMLGARGSLMELRRKGVEDHLASQVVAEAREQGVFEDSVWQLGRRMAAKTEGLDRQVRRRRFWSAGGRKGHDPEALRRVAHELFDGGNAD